MEGHAEWPDDDDMEPPAEASRKPESMPAPTTPGAGPLETPVMFGGNLGMHQWCPYLADALEEHSVGPSRRSQ